MRLLDTSNAKTSKGWRSPRGDAYYLQGVLYLEAADATPGLPTVCPWAGACRLPCLNYSGTGIPNAISNKRKARQEKTRRWFKDRAALLDDIRSDIQSIQLAAKVWAQKPIMPMVKKIQAEVAARHGWGVPEATRRKGGKGWGDVQMVDLTTEQLQILRKQACLPEGREYTPVVRLNGTSDIDWVRTGIIGEFPHIQFLDYTKSPTRMKAFLAGQLPKNYHLTFSMGGTHDHMIPEILRAGGNVTMVFDGYPPKHFGGQIVYRKKDGSFGEFRLPETAVLNGDRDDLRFLDEVEKRERGIRGGCIIGLKYKHPMDPAAKKRIADAHDPLKGFVFDPGSRQRVTHESAGVRRRYLNKLRAEAEARANPSRCYEAPDATAFRFGCGGTTAPYRWR